MENLKNLEKIAKIFQPQNIITSEEIDQVLKGIMEILASYKKGTDTINEETKAVVNSLLEQTIKYNQETISDFKSEAEKAHAERMKELQTFLGDVKTMVTDIETVASELKNGEDADEERVIEEVINRIKIDPTVVTMSAEEVRDKLASLKDEERLDKSAIKGLEKVLQQKDLDYAVATLQHQASFLINKGGLKVVSHDNTLTGDGTPENPLAVAGGGSGITLQTNGTPNGSQTLLNLVGGTNVTLTDNGTGSVTIDSTGGSGSPGGSTTQLQYNNSGSFGGISGATTDGTAVTYTTGNLKGADIKASSSGGLQILSNNGTVVSLHGAGGGANNTFYGDVKLDYATATTVPYLDASKNLISSAVTPTELGYVSGVTSSIQTQLNAKGAGTVTNVSSTNGALTVVNGTTTPVLTVNSAPILTTARTIGTITGDATSAGSSFDGSANNTNTLTLATVNSNVGTFGSATQASQVTVNAKGLVTAASNVTVTPAVGSITGLGTGVGTALAVNVGTAGSPVVNGGALGTPSSGTVTNLTGTASININGTVGATTPNTGSFTTVTTSGNIELGNASDTTLSRSAAGQLAVEGVDVLTTSNTKTVTGKTIQAPLIDYVIEPASDDTYEGEATNDINAGDTIAQWDLTYLDSTSGRWEFADADAVATSGGVLLALAAEAKTDGQAMNVVLRGIVRNDAWTWSGAGKSLYVSTTAGGMTETAPSGASDVIRVVGYTLSDDSIYFNPDNAWVVHT